MSVANRVLRQLHEFLSAFEFRQVDPPGRFERRRDGLVQGIEVQRGDRGKKGQFTLNVYWWFESNLSPGTLSFWQRLGWFRDPPEDLWFLSTTDDDAWRGLTNTLEGGVLPFLDEHRTPAAILDSVDQDALAPEIAFGEDPGWRDFTWAVAAGHAGREDVYRDRLRSLNAFAKDLNPDEETDGYLHMLKTGEEMLRDASVDDDT